MAGIDVPISFTVTGKGEVESALNSIGARLNELAQSKKEVISQSVTKSLFPSGAGIESLGDNKKLLKLVEQAQKRVLNTESLAKLQEFSQSKDFESNTGLSALVARQQSPLASLIRQADAAGLGVQNSKGELKTEKLAIAIKQNILSLLERGRLTSKQLAEIEKLFEKGDFEKLAQILQSHEAKNVSASQVKDNIKKLADEASNNVKALTTAADAAGTAAQQVGQQIKVTSVSGPVGNPKPRPKGGVTTTTETGPVTNQPTRGTGGGGGNPGGPGGVGGVPGEPDPIDTYLSRVSRRFSAISTSFLRVNEVARGSLRSLTPESVETFLNQFGKTLQDFRNKTVKVLEQEGGKIGATPKQNARLSELIFGTSKVLSSPEFANLNKAEVKQQARLIGEQQIAAIFPDMTDEQREKALRIFTTQVAQTTKAYKLLAETVENINVKLGQLNREEANVIVSRIRPERNPALAQQAQEKLKQRRVIFAGQDLQYQESTVGALTPAEQAALSPSVANDIIENENAITRNANQAGGAPRSGFEQLATLGGRLAAIISLVQFTIGSTIQTLAQFTDQANRLEKVSATVNALSGSFTGFSEALKLAATQQQKFGGTLEENLQGLSALIPVSKRYGADLNQLDNIARRLAIVDPLQGFSGASIALKEFFSGDITSLSRRFEIDRATLNSIKEAGDKTAQLQKLDDVLNKLGISNEVLNARTETTAAVFDRLGSTTNNLQVLFGNFIQDALSSPADSLNRFLGRWGSLTSQVESDRAIILGISSDFATLAEKADQFNRTSDYSKQINGLQQVKAEVNRLIERYNELNNTEVKPITDITTARQLAQIGGMGKSTSILNDLEWNNTSSLFFDRKQSAIGSARESFNAVLGNFSDVAEAFNKSFTTGTVEQFVAITNISEVLTDKFNQLNEKNRTKLTEDAAKALEKLNSGKISLSEFIDLLIEISAKNYEVKDSFNVVAEAATEWSKKYVQQRANLEALIKPVLSYETSLEIVKSTIEQTNEFTKKQTQTQLEQFALAQRLGSAYSEQARAKNAEFAANKQLLASEEFDRNDYLAKFGQSITLQARLALEQEKSIGIIGLMRDGLLGYNVTLTEAVGLAKELQNSFRGLATGSLLSALPVGQQLQFQQGVLSGSGPFAARNQNEAFGAVTSIIGLEMKRSDMQRQLGQRLTDIAKDDATRRQKLQEDYNKDLLKMQEDYEKRKLELLKKSEVDKRQGKVDFYSSLMNADKLTPEQQKMLSGKYETLFGQVSELRNQGQFDKATAVLEAGTTQITNEMNYLQEVANQKENIKEADKDIAKLQEDYNKADSADSRKSILDKIEQRRQDKDTAENRIKQLGEIRTLQTDADNERVKTATEAEDKITNDYNKQVDERKKAYLDALKEQDAAYKKSVDDAKKQSQELYDQNITSLNFLTALGVFSETIPNLFKQMLSAGRDPEGLDRIDAKISEAERTLLEATPATLRPTISALITTLEKLNAGPSQKQINPEDPLPTALDKVATSTDELKTSIDILNSTLKTYMAGGYYR